jgi:hypothetical protein
MSLYLQEEFVMKVKIIDNSNVFNYGDGPFPFKVGDIVEVTDSGSRYKIVNPTTNWKYFFKWRAVVVGQEETFTPKSGMIAKTVDGGHALFVEVEGDLVLIYDGSIAYKSGSYTTYSPYSPNLLTTNDPYGIKEIYRGMCGSTYTAGLNAYLPQSAVPRNRLWRRPDKEVKLNDQYTAVVRDGKVTVGCQTFDGDKIKEIAKLLGEK